MAKIRTVVERIRCMRLIFASSLALSCSALVSHRLFRVKSVHRLLQPHLDSESCPQMSSPETNFWIARTQNNTTCSSFDGIPAIPRLDRESGPLPPGAYRKSIVDARETIAPCLIQIGIRPPAQADAGENVWSVGVRNCQSLIDSGFNTFRVNNNFHRIRDSMHRRDNRRRSPLSDALERMQQLTINTEYRHQAESEFYRKLRQNTPSSVLRSCHFMVNLELPLALSGIALISGMENEIAQAPFGNGWMLRESVSSALLRTKSEHLDSVVLEYSENSPYHLDAIDTLFELKREGLIQSISTKNFPPSLLLDSLSYGFNVHSNEVIGNVMNTNNLLHNSPTEVSRIISAPLGGGLFTKQFSQFREWAHLSPARRNKFNALLDCCCGKFATGDEDSIQKWKKYRTIIDALVDMSLKYQVSVESIALRWLLQLNNGDSISVGTLLGMDLAEEQGGQPYRRQRDLREVFTFSLEENDVEELHKLSDCASRQSRSGASVRSDIDFTDRRLFL